MGNGQGSSGNSNPPPTQPAASASGGSCVDKNGVCPGWSKAYSCSSTTIKWNGSPMLLNKFCPKSCGTCSTTTQLDGIATTAMFAMDDGPGGAVPTVELASSDTAIGVLHNKRQQSYEPLCSEQVAEEYGSQYGVQPQQESVPELEQRSNML